MYRSWTQRDYRIYRQSLRLQSFHAKLRFRSRRPSVPRAKEGGPGGGRIRELQSFIHYFIPEVQIPCQLQLPPLPSYADRMYSQSQAAGSSNSGHTTAVASTLQPPPSERPQVHPTFGIDLAEQMNRDQVEIPLVVEKCCAAIEKYGLRSQGIYRISGTQTKVWKLKERLDKGLSKRDRFVSYFQTDTHCKTLTR